MGGWGGWVKLQPPGSPGEARRSDGGRVNRATNHGRGCLRLAVPAQAERRAGAPTRRHHVPQSHLPSGARVTGSSDSLQRQFRRHRAGAPARSARRSPGPSRRRTGGARPDSGPGACRFGIPHLREGAARRFALPGAQAAVPAFPRGERRPRPCGPRADRAGGAGRPAAALTVWWDYGPDPYQPPPPPPPAGLYMTQAHFTQTFEGWLRGSPEFEVHILGQSGQTDSLKDYQCAGEHRSMPYYFDQNSLDWSGSAMLFSRYELDNYAAEHPGQNPRVFVVEDDDEACVIKANKDLFKQLTEVVDAANQTLTAGKDTTTSGGAKLWKYAKALLKLFTSLASLFNSNDELVGNAVQDSIAGEDRKSTRLNSSHLVISYS